MQRRIQPELLKEIIAELGDQLQPIARDPRLQGVEHTLTLVDGTLLKGLPVLVQAGMQNPRAAKLEAKVRLHTQFDLERGVPIRIDVTEGIGKGENSEAPCWARPWKKAIVTWMTAATRSSSFSTRSSRPRAVMSAGCAITVYTRSSNNVPLCDEDLESSVLLDSVVRMGDESKAEAQPDHIIRLVVVKTTPHEKRGGPASNGQLLIATRFRLVGVTSLAL